MNTLLNEPIVDTDEQFQKKLEEVKTLIKNKLPDPLGEIGKFVFTSKYARYLPNKRRRETFEETVDRSCLMHLDKFKHLSSEDRAAIIWAFDQVKAGLAIPSMRSLQYAGDAIDAINERIYNCAAGFIGSIRSFSEAFFMLLAGCGVTFGLNKDFMRRLPDLVNSEDKTGTVLTYVIEDSVQGWADSIESLLSCYLKNTAFTGRKIIFDYSKIRKKGLPLKTSGGKAPGHEGLKASLETIKKHLDFIIERQKLTRLRTIDAYDILMHCADAVLSGGNRRAATAVIFYPDDEDMLNAKVDFPIAKIHHSSKDEEAQEGQITLTVDEPARRRRTFTFDLSSPFEKYEYDRAVNDKLISWSRLEPQRARSNNSVILVRDEVEEGFFRGLRKMTAQYGEPGFVFANNKYTLYNPCMEVSFQPVTKDGRIGYQFCNLTSINGAKMFSKENFFAACKAASLIGTLQASYTNLTYSSNTTKELTEEEALLGVSITGIMDNPNLLLDPEIQKQGAEIVKEVNKQWAAKIGINKAARTTLVKPEGTASLVVKSASGIHPHHAKPLYFRRVQCNKKDNVFQYLEKINPHAVEESVWSASKSDKVVAFPIAVSETVLSKEDLSALEHLEIIKNTQINWVNTGTTEANQKDLKHNVSCTVLVGDDEWEAVMEYLFKNREYFSAVSLLPKTGDKIYRQAPLEAVTTLEDLKNFESLVKNWTPLDFSLMKEYSDNTSLNQEAACAGGACETFQVS